MKMRTKNTTTVGTNGTATRRAYPEVDSTGTEWKFPRCYPPVDSCDGNVGGWLWRLNSAIYRRKIKRSVEAVARYRQTMVGNSDLSRQDVDACHRLLDTLSFDANRRGSGRKDGTRETLMGDGHGDGAVVPPAVTP